MKPQLITYILAVFCALAIISCNKETAIDSMGPDTEYTVLLEASIDASTKAVSIDESKVVCTWAVDETVDLVRNDTIISSLKVVSVNGNKAQLSGKVKGAYKNTGTPMRLCYGGNSYDYSGQTGTAPSAVSKAYLTAETEIKSQSGKTLTLESVTLEHQQAYMGLSFYIGGSPVKVKSVKITEGGSQIVKTYPLGGSETTYGSEEFFTVTAPSDGQEVFFFALRDNKSEAHEYTLTITASDSKVYTGKVTAPRSSDNGNYFTDSKVILVRLSPVITAPAVYSHINYDGLPHDLITPAVVRPGAIVKYCVSNTPPSDDYAGWSESVPREINTGTYKVWYKVSGAPDYENILTTKVGTVTIQ